VAVTSGLEAAEPRLLKLLNKGLTIEQFTTVAANFKQQKILVHAYLMYGLPSQTAQETIDSLEIVRQLFCQGCLDSAFFHRFVLTVHSPIAAAPDKFGITIVQPAEAQTDLFANNAMMFNDTTNTDHEILGEGLRRAVYNYMHGQGLAQPLQFWFSKKIPQTTVATKYIARVLKQAHR
jgi:hypothetical protein